jgi:perosamine synthetase
LGHCACFSLGRGKAVFGGEGGIMVTNDRTFYEKAVTISQHPLRIFREVTGNPGMLAQAELNWNYRIHPLATVLALADLELSSQRIAHRKRILDMVLREGASISGIEAIRCKPEDSSAACGVPMTYNGQRLHGRSRDSFIESMYGQGISIGPGPVRVPIHLRPTFQKNQNNGWVQVNRHASHVKGSCPVAERRCEREEILLFDANTMDRAGANDTSKIIEKLKNHCEVFSRTADPFL